MTYFFEYEFGREIRKKVFHSLFSEYEKFRDKSIERCGSLNGVYKGILLPFHIATVPVENLCGNN